MPSSDRKREHVVFETGGTDRLASLTFITDAPGATDGLRLILAVDWNDGHKARTVVNLLFGKKSKTKGSLCSINKIEVGRKKKMWCLVESSYRQSRSLLEFLISLL